MCNTCRSKTGNDEFGLDDVTPSDQYDLLSPRKNCIKIYPQILCTIQPLLPKNNKKKQKEHGDFSVPGFFKEFKPVRRGV